MLESKGERWDKVLDFTGKPLYSKFHTQRVSYVCAQT